MTANLFKNFKKYNEELGFFNFCKEAIIALQDAHNSIRWRYSNFYQVVYDIKSYIIKKTGIIKSWGG